MFAKSKRSFCSHHMAMSKWLSDELKLILISCTCGKNIFEGSLSHCSRNTWSLGFFCAFICITIASGPAFWLSSGCTGLLLYFTCFLGPGIPLESSFLTMLKGLRAGPQFPPIRTGFHWEVCFCLRVHMWAFGILFPGHPRISYGIYSQVISVGCSFLNRLGKSPGTGVFRHSFQ